MHSQFYDAHIHSVAKNTKHRKLMASDVNYNVKLQYRYGLTRTQPFSADHLT